MVISNTILAKDPERKENAQGPHFYKFKQENSFAYTEAKNIMNSSYLTGKHQCKTQDYHCHGICNGKLNTRHARLSLRKRQPTCYKPCPLRMRMCVVYSAVTIIPSFSCQEKLFSTQNLNLENKMLLLFCWNA